ncbi:hypothetical protein B9Z55_005544 [Caenorhabditis nigoni]|uniref:Uncharacterized protein n=1 Tax=Caenorhabditis nigoni TaxID=1611254 RepID=A0A2G5V198_9PELO|nr:hypothetical protein B9Z55_005544 [Caenorhabditis nigoni]
MHHRAIFLFYPIYFFFFLAYSNFFAAAVCLRINKAKFTSLSRRPPSFFLRRQVDYSNETYQEERTIDLSMGSPDKEYFILTHMALTMKCTVPLFVHVPMFSL